MSENPKETIHHDRSILVNKLTVKDAEHLVKAEGGSLSKQQAIFRIISTLIVAIFTARAIVVGKATAWHLFLPMVGEYFVLLFSLPVIRLILRDSNLRKDARRSLTWIFSISLLSALWIGSRSFDEGTTWSTQARLEFSRLSDWITTHQMHWPILGAMVAMIAGFPSRIAAFRRHGPPFVAVGLGCAMRLVIPLFGCFLLPLLAAGTFPLVWAIWIVLLLSELGALAMHWDLQRRLAKRGIEV